MLPYRIFLLALLVLLSACGEATLVNPPDRSSNEINQATTADVVAPNVVVEEQVDEELHLEDQPSKEFTIADVTDLVLVTGQSNALGALTDYDANLDAPHERVFAFTENGWQRADLHQVWDRGWFPRAHPDRNPVNNVALHIGKQLVKQDQSKVVGFILVTAPGQGIAHWNIEGSFFQEIDQRVLTAINQMPHKSKLDGIIWHQGESDDGDLEYASKLDRLIRGFRLQNWYSQDGLFICGETAEFDVVNEQLMRLNNNGDDSTACVESDGLQTFGDGYHFSAPGLRELGRRYAEKYLQLD